MFVLPTTVDDPKVQQCLNALARAFPLDGSHFQEKSITGGQLAANAVGAAELADNAVDTAAIQDDAVTSPKIAENAVGASEIADNAVDSAALQNNSVTAAKIGPGEVGQSEIADDAVGSGELQDDSVGANHILESAVGAPEIAADAVGSDEIADNAVGSQHIAKDAVGADEIVAEGVGSAEIAKDAVNSTHIAKDAVGSDEIAANAVGASEIAEGAVGAPEIEDGAVGTNELANNAVTTGKIAEGAVGTTDIADDAVTQAKIGEGAVGSTEVAAGAIGNDEMADDAVGAAEIIDGAVGISAFEPGAVGVDAAATSLPDALLQLEPLLYVTLEAGGAGLTDQSGNGRNGTANGGLAIGGGGSLLAGDAGSSTDFDGVNDYVSFAYSPYVANSLRTFFAIVKNDSVVNPAYYFSGSGANRPTLQQVQFSEDFNDLRFQADLEGGTAIFDPNSTGSAALAVFLIWDDEAQNAEVWVNGSYRGKLNIAGATGDYGAAPGNLELGRSGAALFGDQKMNNVAVFDGRLSAATIQWVSEIALERERAIRDWGFVSALPPAAETLVGDTCTYIADVTNGVYWQLVYDGVGTYPWKKIGGPPLYAASNNLRSLTNKTAYESLPTDPLKVTAPLKGDYDIRVEAATLTPATASAAGMISYAIGATAASDNWAGQGISAGAAAVWEDAGRVTRQKEVAAAAEIIEKAKTFGNYKVEWTRRRLTVDPVRVG